MAEPIGALRVDLSANAAEFEKDMGRARRAVSTNTRGMSEGFANFRESVANTIKSVFSFRNALIAVAGVAALGLLVNKSLAAADAIGKTADKIGLGVEALQEYRYAAELAGVSSGTLDMALQRFSRRFGEAAVGTGELKGVLEDYNIATRNADGSIKSLDQALGEYADTIQRAENDQERLRLAFKGFDSEGAALVNMLRNGSAGLAQVRQEARELGLVLGEDMVREAERANDQMTRMSKILQTQLTRVVVSLAPQVIQLGNAFAGAVPKIMEWINQFVPTEFQPVDALRERIGALQSEIAELQAEMDKPSTGFLDRMRQQYRAVEVIPPQIAKLRAELEALEEILEKRIRQDEMVEATLTGSTYANDEMRKAIEKLRGELQFEVDQLSRTEVEQELYNIAKKEGVEVNDQFRASIKPMLDALEAHKEATKKAEEAEKERQKIQDAGKALTDEVRTAQEVYNDTIEEMIELLDKGAISNETFERGAKKAKKTLDESSEAGKRNIDMARDLGATFTSAFEDAVVSGGKLSDVLRGIEQDILRIMLRKLVIEPLTTAGTNYLGGLFGGGGMAGGGVAANNISPGLQFADGGTHKGGFRLVGERGPELEYTGPSRIFSNEDTRNMLGGGGEVTVNVYAPPGSSVETRESEGPGGRSLDIILDEATAKNIGTPGSRTARAMRMQFAGLNPQLQGR